MGEGGFAYRRDARLISPGLRGIGFSVGDHATAIRAGFDSSPRASSSRPSVRAPLSDEQVRRLDLDKKAGWYQGRLTITESRAGTLAVQGSKLVVTRPAMFERFGVMITQEQFTVDRTTGEFVQSLTVQDGRVIKLIKGTCAKVIKPPF